MNMHNLIFGPILPFLGMGFFIFILAMLSLLSVVAVVWAIVDCLNSNKDSTEKLIWVLIIVFLNIIGVLIYIILKDENMTNKFSNQNKVLTKSKDNKIFFGVCGGLGKYFNIDPTIIRLFLVLLFFFRGTGLLLYIVAAIIIPDETSSNKSEKEEEKNKESENEDKEELKKDSNEKKSLI